jgi:4-diphosphocytidyl-2-C-methyl-D-erythritol kinase
VFFFRIYDNLCAMSAITIEAPAKLNLHLKVGGRRPDGFHDIESLFVALAFGDTLYLETTLPETATPPEISMNWQIGGPAAAIPPEKNIISRAVSLFRSRTGFNQGVKVTVEKRIPPGGGLGGGSSDAAAALLALNCLAADGGLLNAAELAEMGALLGSDVPFFLHETPAAWVTGRGERIQPLELPESVLNLAFVLVNPGFSSDTAEAYRLLDSWREGSGEWGGGIAALGNGGRDSKYRSTTREQYRSPNNDPYSLLPTPYSLISPKNWPFTNDFLPVLSNSDRGTTYQRVITELRELGAEFAGLSGSGSTCFGVFSGQEQAELAREALLERWPFVIISFLLARRAIPCYNNK